MAFHGLFAWRDDRFETKWFASRVLSRMRFSYRKLSDGPPQKVEAYMALIFPQGMGDFRLAGFEFQSHRAQPCLQKTFDFLHSCLRWMKNDQIIGVTDELRDALLVREGSSYHCFDSMQGDIHEERGCHSSLRGAFDGLMKAAILKDASFEPCFDHSLGGRVGVQFVE